MTPNQEKRLPDLRPRGDIVFHAVVLAVASIISFLVTTRILAGDRSVTRDDDLLGGMWAVVAAVVVCRYGYRESVSAALARMAATAFSFVLCLAYLLIFPFSVWGLALLIALATVLVALAGRPDDTITTTITITVVMVVAAISPQNAWRQPILRFIDTAVGVAVGVGAAWISGAVMGRQTVR